MKYNIILSFICVFVSLVSCSMENDIIDNGTSYPKLSDADAAYVSFSISTSDAATKAGTDLSGIYQADPITNCALFLLDANEQVVGVTSDMTMNDGVFEKIEILTKVGLAKTAVVVVNYNTKNKTSLLNCSSLADIEAYRESDPAFRMKQGKSTIDWSTAVSGSATDNVLVVKMDIKVFSATSLIELNSFKVTYAGAGSTPEVELTEVSLTNLKVEGGLYDEGADNTIKSDYVSMRIPSAEENGYQGAPLNIIKNVYPNTNETSPVKMRIKFTVDGATADVYGKPYEREYIINRPTDDGFINNSGHIYVESGYLYSLNVTVTVHTGKVDCAFDCVVKDWIPRNIDLGSITGSKDTN